MSRVESAMGAQQAPHMILGRTRSRPPVDRDGALTFAKQAVNRVIASAGFVNITGQLRENLQIYLNREPVQIGAEYPKPEFLVQLASWVTGKMAKNEAEAKQAQAHVRPEAAVKLLK